MLSVEDDENCHTRSRYTNKVKKFQNQLLTKVVKVLLNIDGNAAVKPESPNIIAKDFSNFNLFSQTQNFNTMNNIINPRSGLFGHKTT